MPPADKVNAIPPLPVPIPLKRMRAVIDTYCEEKKAMRVVDIAARYDRQSWGKRENNRPKALSGARAPIHSLTIEMIDLSPPRRADDESVQLVLAYLSRMPDETVRARAADLFNTVLSGEERVAAKVLFELV